MNRRIFTAALSALLLTGVSAFAQSSNWTIDKNHAQTNFQIATWESAPFADRSAA